MTDRLAQRAGHGSDGPALTVDLGGTRTRAAIVDGLGPVPERSAAPTPQDARGPDALVALATDELQAKGDTAFADAFDRLLGCIGTKAQDLREDDERRKVRR